MGFCCPCGGAFLRSIAYRTSVAELLGGEYKPSGGEYDPSFVRVGLKEVNRCNVIGTITGVNPILLDDGTGQIKVLVFNEHIKANAGDIVRVIGKVREKDGERFINAEIVRPVSEEWLELRKLELASKNKPEIQELEV